MRNNGFKPDRIVMAGGATRSPLWLQIHADVSNLPLTITKVPDAPSLGCAILAATGAGLFPDVSTAVEKICLLYTSPSPRDATLSRMPSSA